MGTADQIWEVQEPFRAAQGYDSRSCFDLICAFNFSYSYFRKRSQLKEYFACVREALDPDRGVFVLDAHGGANAFSARTERNPLESDEPESDEEGEGGGGAAADMVDGIEIEWAQRRVDPITGDLDCELSFFFPDGSSMAPAFTYAFRYWGLAELQDVLKEAGFAEVVVFWPDADEEDGELTGE